MTDDAAPDEDLDDADSGPFCQHFGDPVDCDVRCASCGHACCRHIYGGYDCLLEECECTTFANPPGNEAP